MKAHVKLVKAGDAFTSESHVTDIYNIEANTIYYPKPGYQVSMIEFKEN